MFSIVLMAAHTGTNVLLAHEGLEEILTQAHAAVARQPKELGPRLQEALLAAIQKSDAPDHNSNQTKEGPAKPKAQNPTE